MAVPTMRNGNLCLNLKVGAINKDEKKKVNKSGQHIVGHPRNDILMTFFYLHLVLRFGAQPTWKCYWAEVYLSERDARM